MSKEETETPQRKKCYRIRHDGTGPIEPSECPADWESGTRAVVKCYFNTYAEARDYAKNTTRAARIVAEQNQAAAWALPEHEPEGAE